MSYQKSTIIIMSKHQLDRDKLLEELRSVISDEYRIVKITVEVMKKVD